MRIARAERRQEGDTTSSLVVLAYPFAVVVAVLRNAPEPLPHWQARLCIAQGTDPDKATYDLDAPIWRSEIYDRPQPPLDALIARLANLGLPPDATPLCTALLPPV